MLGLSWSSTVYRLRSKVKEAIEEINSRSRTLREMEHVAVERTCYIHRLEEDIKRMAPHVKIVKEEPRSTHMFRVCTDSEGSSIQYTRAETMIETPSEVRFTLGDEEALRVHKNHLVYVAKDLRSKEAIEIEPDNDTVTE